MTGEGLIDEVSLRLTLTALMLETKGVRDFSRRMGIDPSLMSKILRGQKRPPASLLKKLGYRRLNIVMYAPEVENGG